MHKIDASPEHYKEKHHNTKTKLDLTKLFK